MTTTTTIGNRLRTSAPLHETGFPTLGVEEGSQPEKERYLNQSVIQKAAVGLLRSWGRSGPGWTAVPRRPRIAQSARTPAGGPG